MAFVAETFSALAQRESSQKQRDFVSQVGKDRTDRSIKPTAVAKQAELQGDEEPSWEWSEDHWEQDWYA